MKNIFLLPLIFSLLLVINCVNDSKSNLIIPAELRGTWYSAWELISGSPLEHPNKALMMPIPYDDERKIIEYAPILTLTKNQLILHYFPNLDNTSYSSIDESHFLSYIPFNLISVVEYERISGDDYKQFSFIIPGTSIIFDIDFLYYAHFYPNDPYFPRGHIKMFDNTETSSLFLGSKIW